MQLREAAKFEWAENNRDVSIEFERWKGHKLALLAFAIAHEPKQTEIRSPLCFNQQRNARKMSILNILTQMPHIFKVWIVWILSWLLILLLSSLYSVKSTTVMTQYSGERWLSDSWNLFLSRARIFWFVLLFISLIIIFSLSNFLAPPCYSLSSRFKHFR